MRQTDSDCASWSRPRAIFHRTTFRIIQLKMEFGERKRRRKSRSFKLVTDEEGRLLRKTRSCVWVFVWRVQRRRLWRQKPRQRMSSLCVELHKQTAYYQNYTLKKRIEKHTLQSTTIVWFILMKRVNISIGSIAQSSHVRILNCSLLFFFLCKLQNISL